MDSRSEQTTTSLSATMERRDFVKASMAAGALATKKPDFTIPTEGEIDHYFTRSLDDLGAKIQGIIQGQETIMVSPEVAVAGATVAAVVAQKPNRLSDPFFPTPLQGLPPRDPFFGQPLGMIGVEIPDYLDDGRRRTIISLAAGLGALGLAACGISTSIMDVLRKTQAAPTSFHPDDVYEPLPTPTSLPAGNPSGKTPVPAVIPKPVAEPTKTPDLVIGNQNAVEFFLGNLVEIFQAKRMERYAADPAFRERVDSEMLRSNTINFVIMGLDQARWRATSWSNYGENGYGNNDVSLVLSINPHTLQVRIISFPRDLFDPAVQEYYYRKGADPIKFDSPVRRINGICSRSQMSKEEQFAFGQSVFETATGLPIDGVVTVNMDFVEETFIDLYPNGLEVNVPDDIDITYLYGVDAQNREVKTIHHFKKGKQKLTGRDLLAYVRTRKEEGGSDDTRGSKQRDVLQFFIIDFATRVLTDLKAGRTDTLQLLSTVIKKQQSVRRNITASIAVGAIVEKVIGQIALTIGSNRNWKEALTALVVNTTLQLSPKSFKSEGIGAPMVGEIRDITRPTKEEATLQKIDPYLRYLAQSKVETDPTRLGNYLNYWRPLRARVKELYR